MSHPFLLLHPPRPSSVFQGKCALAVMAKAPVAGQVKTRLSPPLTPEQAAGLNACFLRDTAACLADAAAATDSRWVISYTPAGEETAFQGILAPGSLLLAQRGNGFGERLLSTAKDLFACGFASVCLIDSDSPTVPVAAFIQAVEALHAPGDRIALGASADGGYYLLGLKHPHPQLFENIAWSTNFVARQTHQRAEQLGLPIVSLPDWYDIDESESLDRLRRELFSGHSAPGGYPAPFTRAYLRQIGLSYGAFNEAELANVPD